MGNFLGFSKDVEYSLRTEGYFKDINMIAGGDVSSTINDTYVDDESIVFTDEIEGGYTENAIDDYGDSLSIGSEVFEGGGMTDIIESETKLNKAGSDVDYDDEMKTDDIFTMEVIGGKNIIDIHADD